MMEMSSRRSSTSGSSGRLHALRPASAAPRHANRREALLETLRAAHGPLTVGQAASSIGTTVSTARFHLALLVSAGLVIRRPLRSGAAGRPSWLYAPGAPAGASDPYREFSRALAAQLDEADDASGAAREAGRRWAAVVAEHGLPRAATRPEAVASLTAMLERLGFAPDPCAAEDEIVLHACPFEVIAREHRGVVCGAHLGLVEQAAETIGGGIVLAGLEPFRVELPLTCAIRLHPQHPPGQRAT
jgi:predicted ArsR family transcriptional regulator